MDQAARQWLLPAALWRLLELQWRSQVRRAWRGLSTWRGRLYGAGMLGLTCLWLLPAVIQAFTLPRVPSENVGLYLTPGLMMFWLMGMLTGASELGVQFQRAEVDQLFPAPFRRRDLLLYRVVQVTLGLAFLALWLSLALMRFGTHGVAVYAGVFLGLLMLSLLQMLVGLLASSAAATLYGRIKWFAIGGLAVAVVAAGWLAWPRATTGSEWLREVTAFGPVQFVLFPFRLISETIAARRLFPDLLIWGGGLLLFDLWLILAILALDADFLERSVTASERMYERLKRMQRGQGLVGGKMRSRVRPPLPPYVLGAGPIAWRQAVLVMRSVSAWILLGGMLLMSLVLPAVLKWLTVRPEVLIGPVVSLSVFLLPQLLQFDFRSDVDRLEILKSLPVKSGAVVLGQLAVPVGLSVAQWWLLALACAAMNVGSSTVLWGLVALALPVNLYLFSVENLFCLVFPFRVATGGTGDLHAAARNMMVAAGKLLTSILGLVLAAGIGGLVWWLTKRELLAVMVGAAGGMLLVAALLIVGCVLAYDRIDAGRAASE